MGRCQTGRIRNKGESLIAFPNNFTVVDIETTGFSPIHNGIIEVAALKVRDGKVIDRLSTLVYTDDYINPYVAELTGICNEDLYDAPYIEEVVDWFVNFVGDDILVGHNVNFDINFLYDAIEDYLGVELSNDYVDTLRIARKVLPGLAGHKLIDLVNYFGIKGNGFHRAINDCEMTLEIFKELGNL